MSDTYMFGKQEVNCQYCKRSLPHKYCARHSPKTTITRVQLYTAEQVAQAERAAQERLLEELVTKADAEYPRHEVDNWTFSLGAITSDRYYVKRQALEEKRES